MRQKRITVTKEWLQALGVTDVTRDGRIFVRGKESRFLNVICKHKYGKDKSYPTLAIYDPVVYKRQVAEGKLGIGQRRIIVSRVVYAWFNDVCPAGLDVDHIDNNPFNNSIDNLRLLTRKENRGRSLPSNERLCKLTQEELQFYLPERKRLKEEINYYREVYKSADELASDKAIELAQIEKKLKKGANNALLEKYEYTKEELSDLRINVFYCKDKWHHAVKDYTTFVDEWKAKMNER